MSLISWLFILVFFFSAHEWNQGNWQGTGEEETKKIRCIPAFKEFTMKDTWILLLTKILDLINV